MDYVIVLVLLFTSALIGAAAGLRFKVFVLVPIALLVSFVSAVVLHENDFGAGSGNATIIVCLVLSQAAYIIVQILTPANRLIPDDVANDEPSTDREHGVRSDNGD